jgi:hypothetical protein
LLEKRPAVRRARSLRGEDRIQPLTSIWTSACLLAAVSKASPLRRVDSDYFFEE